MRRSVIAIALLALSAVTAQAQEKSSTRSMSFEACLAVIASTASELGVAPVNIVETSILRMVRFPTGDGSALVTCSKPDRKMVVTMSASRCRQDVNC